MSETKGLISSISKKWKLDQIPSKKLEIENKLMEERLNQLKNEFMHEKSRRSAQGGTIWAAAQPGPIANYAKTKVNDEHLISRPSNRTIKLQVLKDEMLATRTEKTNSSNSSNREMKKNKCGQCEKNIAFTRCVECCEDYCANCFTSFHLKGALQKHRTLPISNSAKQSSKQISEFHNQNFEEELYILDSKPSNLESGSYRSLSSANSNSRPGSYKAKSNSLLDGVYDEREAHNAFQQALQEWRTGNGNKQGQKTKVKFASSNKDTNVGTDTVDLPSSRSSRAMQDLEKAITSNHSLTYAERMLLQKYRRNDLEYAKPANDSNYQNNSHILVEEVENSLNTKKQLRILEPLAPDLIEYASEGVTFSKTIPDKERENTIKERPKSSRPNSSRPKSAANKSNTTPNKSSSNKANEVNKEPVSQSTILNRKPSSTLQQIAERQTASLVVNNNSVNIGQFLTLNVDQQQQQPQLKPKSTSGIRTPSATSISSSRPVTPVKSSVENFKLSNKFYLMSPRSWMPSKSLAVDDTDIDKEKTLTNNSIDSLASKSMNLPKQEPVKKTPVKSSIQRESSNLSSRSVTFSAKNEVITPKPRTATQSAKKVVKTETSKQTKADQIKKPTVSASIDPKMNPRKDMSRNKSFVGSLKTQSMIEKPKRPASSAEHLVNKLNLSFATEFIKYDEDDGRSSRICQNEEDTDYYKYLETEFIKTSQTGPVSKEKVKPIETDLKELTEQLTRSLTNAEFNLKFGNDELDELSGDLETLTMEELKSLR